MVASHVREQGIFLHGVHIMDCRISQREYAPLHRSPLELRYPSGKSGFPKVRLVLSPTEHR